MSASPEQLSAICAEKPAGACDGTEAVAQNGSNAETRGVILASREDLVRFDRVTSHDHFYRLRTTPALEKVLRAGRFLGWQGGFRCVASIGRWFACLAVITAEGIPLRRAFGG